MKKIRERKKNENKEENFVLALIIYHVIIPVLMQHKK